MTKRNPWEQPLALYDGVMPATDAGALEVAKHYVHQQGYERIEFHFSAPQWKAADEYMAEEGYPLGTTCWYVIVEYGGRRELVCRDTFLDAVWDAHLYLVRRTDEMERE